jgi:hypothetical protein
LSVDDAQERSISVGETPVATRFAGTLGGVASTVTVACAVEVPLPFVAVIV